MSRKKPTLNYPLDVVINKVMEYLNAFEAINRKRLKGILENKYKAIPNASELMLYMLDKDLCSADRKKDYGIFDYLLLHKGCSPTMFSQAAFEFFQRRAKEFTDVVDKSKYPHELQFYAGGKIYLLMHLDNAALQKLTYRSTLSAAISDSEDVVPVFISTENHQKNASILRDNPALIPKQPYIMVYAFWEEGAVKIKYDELDGGQNP